MLPLLYVSFPFSRGGNGIIDNFSLAVFFYDLLDTHGVKRVLSFKFYDFHDGLVT